MTATRPFDADAVVERLRVAVGGLADAAMFELFDLGRTSRSASPAARRRSPSTSTSTA